MEKLNSYDWSKKDMRKVIISLAPVEAEKAIDKEKLVEDVARCERAGAAM